MQAAPYVRTLEYSHTDFIRPSTLAPVPGTVNKTSWTALHFCHPHGRSLKFKLWGGRLKGLFGKDRVCGVAAAETARAMQTLVRLGLRKTRTLELRLDYLRNGKELKAFLSWLRRNRSHAVLIATCRRKEGGGLFQGSREEQIEILAKAAHSGCGWCDIEIETAKHIPRVDLRGTLSPARVM